MAVPFLNSSGVDRNLLREMWTVVDPNMEGSLVEIIQFTSLLKMVSLAQHRCLDMAQYEGQLLYRQVPLSTFFNLVVMPSHQLLLELYPSVTANQLILTAPTVKLSVSDAFGDLAVDAPLPALPVVAPAVVQDDEDFGDLQNAHGATDHVDDDFGDFEGEASVVPTEEFDHYNNNQQQQQQQQQEIQSEMAQEGVDPHVDDNDDFGDFTGTHGIETAVDHSYVGHDEDQQQTELHVPNVVGDDFGDFEGTPLGAAPMKPLSSGNIHAVHNDDVSFGAFGGFSEQRDLSTAAFDEIQPVQNQQLSSPRVCEVQPDDSFGEFEGVSADPKGEGAVVETVSYVSKDIHPIEFTGIADATDKGALAIDRTLFGSFDGIQPIEDQPLPPLHAMVNPVFSSDPGHVVNRLISSDHDDDDFRDFTGIPDFAEQGLAPDGGATFGAFDGIQPIQDQPLPSLDAMVIPAFRCNPDATGGDLHDFADIPDSSGQGLLPEGDATFNAFHGVQSIEDQPLPPLDTMTNPAFTSDHDDVDDDFGDFTDIPDSVPQGSVPEGGATFSAFDAIQPIEDQPLPLLDAMAIPSDAAAVADGDDDDFGDFTSVPHSADRVVVPLDESPFSAFAGIRSIEDQPLASLEVMAPPAVTNDFSNNDDNDFGDFTGLPDPSADVKGTIDTIHFGDVDQIESTRFEPSIAAVYDAGDKAALAVENTPFDAMDGILPIINLPLPSLDPLTNPAGAAAVADDDDDDDFGDFSGVPGATDQAAKTSCEKPFGAFDGIQPMTDQAPLSSNLATNLSFVASVCDDDGDDDFGDFAGIPDTDDQTTRTQDDTRVGASEGFRSMTDEPPLLFNATANPTPTLAADVHDFGNPKGVKDDPLASPDFQSTPSGDTQPIQKETLSPAEAVASANPDIGAVAHPSASAFDEIQPIEDQPLPPLFGLNQLAVGHPSHFEDTPAPSSLSTFTGMEPKILLRPASVQQISGIDPDPFSLFNLVDEGQPDRQLEPLSSYSFSSPPDAHAPGHPNDDSFGDFMTTTAVQSFPAGAESVLYPNPRQDTSAVNAPKSLPGSAFTTQMTDDSDFGVLKVVGRSKDLDVLPGVKTLAPLNLFDSQTSQPCVSEGQPSDDDDDWGDFEHVQVPNVPVDEVSDFFVASGPPEGSMAGFNTAGAPLPPNEFDAFAAFPPDTGNQTAVENSEVAFEADFRAFGDDQAAAQSTAAIQAEEDFGEWDSFQDAPTNGPIGPLSLDEIQGRLLSLTLPGSFTRIDLAGQLKRNILSRNWASSIGGNSSSLKRAKRCLDVVSVLSSSSSNLVCADWNRVLSAVRDEMSIGSFLLQEAKKLPKETKKDVLKPLSIMVSGFSEFLRVVRSIVATVGDVLCLDLHVPLSKESMASAWQSLDIAQLALEVEEAWTSIEGMSKTLQLSFLSRLETLETIRKNALESESASLCQLTLQPFSHEDSTKNEVIWEGKPFMACAANLWSNRVSDSSSYSI